LFNLIVEAPSMARNNRGKTRPERSRRKPPYPYYFLNIFWGVTLWL